MHSTVILNTWTGNKASPTNPDEVTIMTALTTPEQIEAYRLATLRTGLRIELRGMRMTRGRTCYAMLKDMGFTGTRDKVFADVTIILDKYKMLDDKLPADWKL